MTVEILDKGRDEGIVLSLCAEYFGYPAIKSEIRIDSLGKDWLQKVGLMFIAANAELSKIDWEKRYDSK